MTASKPFRRAALLAAALGLAGCDVVAFATDPKPIFEQTWSLPTTPTSISVAELLPASVSVYSTPGSNPPDSGAFLVNINNVSFTSRVGNYCSQCTTANGTTTTKPAFILTSGNASNLPADVVSMAMLSGTVNYSIVNNLSFDPIRVRALSDPTQGFLVVLIHSGSLVLAKDSVNGLTTAFPAGSTLSRSVPLSSGNVLGPITVDLTVNSPQGDHPEFINANGTLQTSAALSSVIAGGLSINVTNKAVSNPPQDMDLKDFGANVVSAAFEMTVLNPWLVAGTMQVNFNRTSVTVTKPVDIPGRPTPQAAQLRSVALDQTDMQSLVGDKVSVTITGTMNAATPVPVVPKQKISIDNRLIVKIHGGGR